MTEKRFTITDDRSISDHQKKRLYDLNDFDGMISVTETLNEVHDENKELKHKNSQLQETLAFRSNQLALMEQLIDDLGHEEMKRQMEEILND